MEKFKFLSKSNLNNLPKTAGVYCFARRLRRPKETSSAEGRSLGEGGFEVIYIGKAINIRDRVKNHFNGKYWWEKNLLRQGFGGQVGYLETNSEIEALILEANLIKKYQPKFNVVWRDDKNYFWVAVLQNKNQVPYIFVTHQPKKQPTANHLTPNKKLEVRSQKLEAMYIGPFVEGTALKKTLRFLRRVFPYYTSKKHPKTKCTWCHLDLCPGPELFENPPSPKASEGLYAYRKNIKKLILILKGKRIAVLKSLKKEMNQLSKDNRFEKAGKIRDKIFALQQIMSHMHVIEIQNSKIKNQNWSETEKIWRKILNINKNILRIECYDVSNIQGKQATASMVVFINGMPDKNQYRKFRIKMKNEPNDIAMLKETLQRRFAHPEWKYPEVILIDGGKAQLNIALQVINQHKSAKSASIRVLAIAKRNKELFIEGKQKPILLKTLPQEIYNLILQLDDEAHRFAIAYHKKLREKNLLK